MKEDDKIHRQRVLEQSRMRRRRVRWALLLACSSSLFQVGTCSSALLEYQLLTGLRGIVVGILSGLLGTIWN